MQRSDAANPDRTMRGRRVKVREVYSVTDEERTVKLITFYVVLTFVLGITQHANTDNLVFISLSFRAITISYHSSVGFDVV